MATTGKVEELLALLKQKCEIFCLFQIDGQYGANFWRSGFLMPLAEEILAV